MTLLWGYLAPRGGVVPSGQVLGGFSSVPPALGC